ncbi:MAG: hypothetical protein ACE5KV_00995, partial [Thermoplasmata archaeon]
MDIIEVALISVFAGIFITLTIWILTQIASMKESIGSVSEKIGRIDERVKSAEKGLDRWQAEMREGFVRIYNLVMSRKGASNPISPNEKNLLRKLRAGQY